MPAMSLTVVIRTRNSAQTLPSCLRSIQAGTVPVRIVVVDCESTDETLRIVKNLTPEARIISIDPDDYTPGLALNRGFEASETPLVSALSSHCELPDQNYYARALEVLQITGADAAVGIAVNESGRQLTSPTVREIWPSGNPFWGFSNHANVVRKSSWQQIRFDERLIACEDKAFAMSLHAMGGSIAYSPHLIVPVRHRRRAGIRNNFRRVRSETCATARLVSIVNPNEVAYRYWRNARHAPGYIGWVFFLLRLMHPMRLIETVAVRQGVLLSKAHAE